jgi:tetratricopeptide (TPR) repeat protein
MRPMIGAVLLLLVAADVDEAQAAYRAFDYARAAELFAAAADAAPDDAARARLVQWQGVARAQLADFDGARHAFRRALAFDPTLEPSPEMAPAVRALFLEEKARVPPPATTTATATATAPAPTIPADTPAPSSTGTALPWIGAATGAVGAAAVVVGAGALAFSQVHGCVIGCGTPERPTATQRESEEARAAYVAGLLIGGVGAVLGAGGAALYALAE